MSEDGYYVVKIEIPLQVHAVCGEVLVSIMMDPFHRVRHTWCRHCGHDERQLKGLVVDETPAMAAARKLGGREAVHDMLLAEKENGGQAPA